MPPVNYHTGGVPPRALNWPKLIPFIGPASAAVARYDGLLEGIPNADVLLAPLTTQEAVLSRGEVGRHSGSTQLPHSPPAGRDGSANPPALTAHREGRTAF